MLEFMKSLPFLLSVVLLSMVLLSVVSLRGQQATPANGAAADPVVLTVGSEKITQSMFQEIIASLPAQQQGAAHHTRGAAKPGGAGGRAQSDGAGSPGA